MWEREKTKDNNKLSYFVAPQIIGERIAFFFKEKEKCRLNTEKEENVWTATSVCFIVYYLINEILTFYPHNDLHTAFTAAMWVIFHY